MEVQQICRLDGNNHILIFTGDIPEAGWIYRVRYIGEDLPKDLSDWKEFVVFEKRVIHPSRAANHPMLVEFKNDEGWCKATLLRCGLPSCVFLFRFKKDWEIQSGSNEFNLVGMVRGGVAAYKVVIPPKKYSVGDYVELAVDAVQRSPYNALETPNEFVFVDDRLDVSNLEVSQGDYLDELSDPCCYVEEQKSAFMVATGEELSDDEVNLLQEGLE